jgi:hypothetical protein
MKKTILSIIVLATLLFPTSFLVIAYEENKSIDGPELQIGIFGASLAGGLRKTGFMIYNNGDEPILNIQYVFSIKSSANNEINYSYSKEIEPLKFNSAYQFVTNEVHGFGIVTLSLIVSSSNAGDKNLSISAFQIGPYTISQPWILSWYNFR